MSSFLTSAYLFSMLTTTYCFNTLSLFSRSCTLKSPGASLRGLENELSRRLFGQPFVIDKVVHALEYHLRHETQKPLAFSFHGLPGTGKSFVASIIVKHLFPDGESSKFVKKYHAKKHFPLQDQVHFYKEILQEDFRQAISQCERSVFIFDEVDKYPAGLLDCVKPYIDYTDNVHGNDYRKAIFIFLTNTGQQIILQNTLQLYKNGITRDKFKMHTFERPLKHHTFDDEGGFYKSELIQSHLINYYIPFLPLERDHVEMCFAVEFMIQGSSYDQYATDVEEALDNITYGPKGNAIFATSGCKGVSEEVGVIIARKRWKDRRGEL